MTNAQAIALHITLTATEERSFQGGTVEIRGNKARNSRIAYCFRVYDDGLVTWSNDTGRGWKTWSRQGADAVFVAEKLEVLRRWLEKTPLSAGRQADFAHWIPARG